MAKQGLIQEYKNGPISGNLFIQAAYVYSSNEK